MAERMLIAQVELKISMNAGVDAEVPIPNTNIDVCRAADSFNMVRRFNCIEDKGRLVIGICQGNVDTNQNCLVYVDNGHDSP